jgi:hypothetical protein
MTMDQFKSKGGVLSGREERYDEFEGVPKNIGGGTAGGFGHIRDGAHHTGSEHHKHGDFNDTPNHHSSGLAGSGAAASGLTGAAGTRSHDHHNTGLAGAGATGAGLAGAAGTRSHDHVGTDGGIGSTGRHADSTDLPRALTEDKSRANISSGHHDSTSSHKKPGLMDKLNPKKDTDGDGKAGIMD